ncbi:MAG: hypothetical protein IT386_07520 [Deltaproteobacteria bacterium]|nr:hypothetical protein [Deltaproteobacteria bacterium]
MRRTARKVAGTLAFAATIAAALPARAQDAAPPPAADAGSCQAPAAEEPRPARTRADLAAISARLAAEAQKAGGDGVRPLNTRGHNYEAGGPDAAALGYEAKGR